MCHLLCSIIYHTPFLKFILLLIFKINWTEYNNSIIADNLVVVEFFSHFNFFFNSGDTLSFIEDQTSYMSICVGEGQDDSLYLLSPQELRQKVKFKPNIKHFFLGVVIVVKPHTVCHSVTCRALASGYPSNSVHIYWSLN